MYNTFVYVLESRTNFYVNNIKELSKLKGLRTLKAQQLETFS